MSVNVFLFPSSYVRVTTVLFIPLQPLPLTNDCISAILYVLGASSERKEHLR